MADPNPDPNPDHYYECATCGQTVYMGDLAAVMLHEHRGITDRVDLSGVAPGRRVDADPGRHRRVCEFCNGKGTEIHTRVCEPNWLEPCSACKGTGLEVD